MFARETETSYKQCWQLSTLDPSEATRYFLHQASVRFCALPAGTIGALDPNTKCAEQIRSLLRQAAGRFQAHGLVRRLDSTWQGQVLTKLERLLDPLHLLYEAFLGGRDCKLYTNRRGCRSHLYGKKAITSV